LTRPSAVAFVPARAGSQRVPGKNVRLLAGHPLLAYSIAAAHDADVFEAVVVATDSEDIAEVAHRYGADVPALRPAEISTATSPDIEWVRWALTGRSEAVFAILRPTSPFRGGEVIRAAFERLIAANGRADSIRAVELCRQHPAKMWTLDGELLEPLLDQGDGVPLHSTQYAALPRVYVQNSSLEIAWSHVATEGGTIAGERVLPWLSGPADGFSIDYPNDLELAERMAVSGEWTLPAVEAVARA
jgi:CMP-N,N'-diacetyllegionaminic acid synthase